MRSMDVDILAVNLELQNGSLIQLKKLLILEFKNLVYRFRIN